jgi:hypothetical protein
MASKSVGDGDLQKKVRERLAFIRKVVLFVANLLDGHGEVIRRQEGSSHTRVASVLKDFGGFSFKYSCGETVMGGNHVYISREGVEPESNDSLLQVYWQASLDECKVEKFENAGSWVKDIQGVMKRKNQIIRQREKEETGAELRRQREEKRALKQKSLLKKAERLGIV